MTWKNPKNKITSWIMDSFQAVGKKIKSFLRSFLIPLIILAVVLVICFQVFPSPTASIVSLLSFGEVVPAEEQLGRYPPLINVYTQKGKSFGCDSNFENDNQWRIERWEKDGNNPQRFVYKPTRKGGPEMTYLDKAVSDNFHMQLSFKPIIEDNRKQTIFFIQVGNFYKLVLDYGNKEQDIFYLEREENEFIPESRTKREKTALPNRIGLNKEITLEIKQNTVKKYIPGTPVTRSILVSFLYTPDEIENAEPILSNGHVFQISDDSFPEEVSRNISLGLFYNKETIVTEFHCLKLEED